MRGLLDSLDQFSDLQLGIEVSPADATEYKSLLAGHALSSGSSKIVAAWKEISLFFCHADRSSGTYINSFARYILDNVSVVRLIVPDTLDLHAIFETINGRGRPLSELDMIKNYVLSIVKDEPVLLNRVRKDFDTIYGYSTNSKKITDYMRCQLQVRMGALPDAKLYRAVKAKLQGHAPKTVQRLLSELGCYEEIGLYKSIVKPLRDEAAINDIAKSADLKDGSRSLIDYLLELSMYSVVQPVLMALLLRFAVRKNRLSAKFICEACRLLASFVMRVVHTRGAFQPSLYEKELSLLAMRIHDGKRDTIGKFKDDLLQLDLKGSVTNVCNDTVFRSILSEISVKHLRKVKQLLVAVENHENRIGMRDADGLSVVHILPLAGQKHPSWGSTNDMQRQLYYNRLGNMCLLEKGLVSAHLQAVTFDQKREIYSQSSMPSTQALSKLSAWNPEAIVMRQKKMAQHAAAIWRFV